MDIRRCAWAGRALGICLAFGVLSAAPAHAAKPVKKAPTGKSRDLVVVDYERWIDTLKGNVKNFGKGLARDVTVVVKFLDKKKKELGTQRVSVGDLRSGDQSAWSLPIADKNRQATSYKFEVHAIWE
jgi:hypothetical protein